MAPAARPVAAGRAPGARCRFGRATACGCSPSGGSRERRPGCRRARPGRGARGVGRSSASSRRWCGSPMPVCRRDVFYNVTGTGIRAGASRVLVLLGWPISHRCGGVAGRRGRPLPGVVASPAARRAAIAASIASALLCATIAWPGVIDEADLDAKPSNALAAVGVGIALLLTLAAVRRARRRRPRSPQTGRRAATALIIVLLDRRDPVDPCERGVLRRRRAGPSEHLHVEADPARAGPPHPPRRPPRKPRGHRRDPPRRDGARAAASAPPDAPDPASHRRSAPTSRCSCRTACSWP